MLSKYLDFAQEQFDKGDYYYALEYYGKAMELDSQTVDILWNYAETLRAYKDYRKAEYYYAKVYEKEKGEFFPSSLLNLGLMQKQNGKYDLALETFKRAKKKYYKDRKSYLYLKSKEEITSCLWAISAIRDTNEVLFVRLPETVNTKNAEFGHAVYNGQLILSSLRADSISAAEEVYEKQYRTHHYSAKINNNQFEEALPITDVNSKVFNSGNGTFSLDGKRFYYSKCQENGYNYTCKIMVAQYKDGSFSSIDSLGEIINVPGANTTMPNIGNVDGQEVLFFSSDREGGKGGMDIWFSVITNGNQYGKPRNLKKINSIDPEVTPWWDEQSSSLYFSSTWHNGFGGFDVFQSKYDSQYNDPQNIGQPFNSPANDLYYFKHSDTSYVSSNRLGVLYSKNPTCCSDIFMAHPPQIVIEPTPKETLADLNKRLPVTLYFHNDIPNPKSWDTLTKVNYIDSYSDYTAMLNKYKSEYSSGLKADKAEEAREDIETFFIEYVDQGVKDLYLFRDLLLEELEKGARINITIQGFASPLAKTDYNVNLTKRRISSLINYLRAYNNGVFVPYLDNSASNGGQVIFSQVPFGEYSANQLTSDNPNDVQNSVYSRAAAIERKIEIQSVSYIDQTAPFPLMAEQSIYSAGVQPSGAIIEHTFTIKNTSEDTIDIKEIEIPCDCLNATIGKKTLLPGEETKVIYTFNSKGYIGHTVKSIYISVNGFEDKLRLIITSELN